jgi:hypothetical protein
MPAPAAVPEPRVPGATRLTMICHLGCRKAPKSNSTRRAGAISNRGWQRRFDDPIPLPRGRQLVTLEDAGKYITKLPKAEHEAAEWQAAMEALILVATSGGPTMFARIGVMRALNRRVERVFDPDRKDHHWGRQKLARDR